VTHPRSEKSGWHRCTERLAFGFVVVLWLGGSIVGIGVEIPVGVAWFCVGAIYVGGELWIERRGDRHPTFSVAWVAAWRAVLGTVMIVLGIVYLSWASIFLFAFGTWFLALAGFFSWALWRDHKLSETNRKAGA
jgi:hypothetical protein